MRPFARGTKTSIDCPACQQAEPQTHPITAKDKLRVKEVLYWWVALPV